MLRANTAAIGMISPSPYFAAAKNAGMPSTIGDEPRISSSAVRAVVLWRCTCSGGSAANPARTGWAVAGKWSCQCVWALRPVPMDVDVAGQQRGVAAQRGVEPIVRRRRPMLVRLRRRVVRVGRADRLPIDRDRSCGWVVADGRDRGRDHARRCRMQLAPGRKRDPAAKADQGDAGSASTNWPKRSATATPAAQTARPSPGSTGHGRSRLAVPPARSRPPTSRAAGRSARSGPNGRDDRVQYADRGDGADQQQSAVPGSFVFPTVRCR